MILIGAVCAFAEILAQLHTGRNGKGSMIVLASASPRRRELLESAGVPVVILVSNIHEEARHGEKPAAYAARNALEKAQSVTREHQKTIAGAVVIGADTIVVKDDKILEKPLDAADAVRMLKSLRNSMHEVITGYVLIDASSGTVLEHNTVSTMVTFRNLSDAEIEAYVATGEPMDKAGSYGAQGKGAAFVKRIEGSYTNVVGLPLSEVMEALLNHSRFSFSL